MNKQIALAALAAVALAACSENGGMTMSPRSAASLAARLTADAAADGSGPGAVYALTNQTSGNAVAVFSRAADGMLAAAGSAATGGTGTGSGLGSQGALALSDDGRWLFAVNAGSNEVSAFRVGPAGLSLTSLAGSGGTRPIGLTVHGSLLYVLNAGGDGNISGFSVGPDGALAAIPGASRALSGAGVGPAQVAFSPDGLWLIVTEKTTNLLDVYAVGPDGVVTGRTSYASAGGTPFGFAFGHRDELFVSEAAGSASSYVLGVSGGVAAVSGAVATHQGAPCWLVVTRDGRFAYTANAQGASISGFAVGTDGSIQLIDPTGLTASVNRGNTDLALSVNSRYLYQLDGSSIFGFQVQADGHLAPAGTVVGLPAGTVGLAAH